MLSASQYATFYHVNLLHYELLDISLEELTDMNIKKLSKRYPAGTFDAYYSENRTSDDR